MDSQGLGAWHQATLRGWNLSYEFLTSAYSQKNVRGWFTEDQEFALSILDNSRKTSGDPEFEEEDTPDHDDDYAIDQRLLCDTRGAPGGSGLGSAFPSDVMEHQSDLLHTGDEYLTGSDEEGCFEFEPTL